MLQETSYVKQTMLTTLKVEDRLDMSSYMHHDQIHHHTLAERHPTVLGVLSSRILLDRP